MVRKADLASSRPEVSTVSDASKVEWIATRCGSRLDESLTSASLGESIETHEFHQEAQTARVEIS
jgi:hypothetical protein